MTGRAVGRARRRWVVGLGMVAALLGLQGCASTERLPAVPATLTDAAQLPGFSAVRYYWEDDPETLLAVAKDAQGREKKYWASLGRHGPLPSAEMLAISGGGDDGAFGAGLLAGWSKAGDRPAFKLVTGISTGSLIAPFAFLGSDYDDELRRIYTTITADDIFERRGLVEALFDDALSDTTPLREMIAEYATPEMLRDVAVEYRKGRLLLVGTTNFDARRPVIWDMGAIAASGHPRALELFRSVLVASASVPGVFPPVMLDVWLDGQPYQEMHVDGGIAAQAFTYPPSISVEGTLKARERRLYVIRNGRLEPEWASVERSTLTLAARAISALIDSQAVGDLYLIYLLAERDGVDFNLASIPMSFHAEKTGSFDPDYMNALFDYGFDQAARGYEWAKHPPGFEPNP